MRQYYNGMLKIESWIVSEAELLKIESCITYVTEKIHYNILTYTLHRNARQSVRQYYKVMLKIESCILTLHRNAQN